MPTLAAAFPEDLLTRCRAAQGIVAFTGAGVSAESGVPTFRDAQSGLWARFRPEDLATPEAFLKNPGLVWDWYSHRRELVLAAAPNAGHRALAELERFTPQFTLVTQNVDGLHQRSGSQRVLELHGNILQTKCSRENTLVSSWADGAERPPRCPTCGSPLRPNVVWFNESLPRATLEQALRASQSCDVFLSIGTSTLVEPAASLPFEAQRAGALVVEINPDQTPLTPLAHHVLRGPAGEVLPALVRAIRAT